MNSGLRLLAVSCVAALLLGSGVSATAQEGSRVIEMVGESYTFRLGNGVPLPTVEGRIPYAYLETRPRDGVGFAGMVEPGFTVRFAVASVPPEFYTWAESRYPPGPTTPNEREVGARSGQDGAFAYSLSEEGRGDDVATLGRVSIGEPDQPPVLVANAAFSETHAEIEGNSARLLSTSGMRNISIGGPSGLEIGELLYEVRAVATGEEGGATVERKTTIAGATLAGEPVRITNDGIRRAIGDEGGEEEVELPDGATLTAQIVPGSEVESSDGTRAAGSADTLFVEYRSATGDFYLNMGLGNASAVTRNAAQDTFATDFEDIEFVGPEVQGGGSSAPADSGSATSGLASPTAQAREGGADFGSPSEGSGLASLRTEDAAGGTSADAGRASGDGGVNVLVVIIVAFVASAGLARFWTRSIMPVA